MAEWIKYTTKSGKIYWVREEGGTFYVTKPSWFPFFTTFVGKANTDKGVRDLIESDAHEKIVDDVRKRPGMSVSPAAAPTMIRMTRYLTESGKIYNVIEKDGIYHVQKPSWRPLAQDSVGKRDTPEGMRALIESDAGEKIVEVQNFKTVATGTDLSELAARRRGSGVPIPPDKKK